MKITTLVISLVLISISSGTSAEENALLKALNDPEINARLVKFAEDSVLSTIPQPMNDFHPLLKTLFGFFIPTRFNLESRIPIIPPGIIPDPIGLPSLNLPNLNIEDLIKGSLSLSNANLGGLSTLHDDLVAEIIENPIGFRVNYTILIPLLSLNSDYNANLGLHIGDAVTPIVGEGFSFVNLTDITLALTIQIAQKEGTADKVGITVGLSLRVDGLALFLENLLIGGGPVDFDPLSEALKTILDLLLSSPVFDTIGNIIAVILEQFTKECTIKEIWDVGTGVEGSDLSCIVIPPLTPVLPTTTTEPPITQSTTPKNGVSTTTVASLEFLTIIGVIYSALIKY